MHLLLLESTDLANNLGDATLYRRVGKCTLCSKPESMKNKKVETAACLDAAKHKWRQKTFAII
jgi:hypothetical protein